MIDLLREVPNPHLDLQSLFGGSIKSTTKGDAMTPAQALEIATAAHEGQFRRPRVATPEEYSITSKDVRETVDPNTYILNDGSKLALDPPSLVWYISEPYITHPITVAEMMQTDEEKVIALLHDVVEDTDYTYERLYDLGLTDLPDAYRNALKLLTKQPGQPYGLYIFNISCCRIATKIKLADMFHNISSNPSKRQREKYLKTVPELLKRV